MFYFSWARKDLKIASKPSPPISRIILLPCLVLGSTWFSSWFSAIFQAPIHHHLLLSAPPIPPAPWVATKTPHKRVLRSPKTAQLCFARAVRQGCFRPIFRPTMTTTATHNHQRPSSTSGCHHQGSRNPKSAPWPPKERYKNPSLILKLFEFLGLL